MISNLLTLQWCPVLLLALLTLRSLTRGLSKALQQHSSSSRSSMLRNMLQDLITDAHGLSKPLQQRT
jgi:hypothetical protein